MSMTANLLTGEERTVYGDSSYLGTEKRPGAVAKNKSGKRIHLQNQPSPFPEQTQFHPFQGTDQAQGT